MSDWEEDDDLSLDTNKNVTESNSGGFGSNRGGFGNKGGFKNDNESSSGGFGSSRGQRNGFGGGGGGFGRDSNNDDDGNRGGFGGGRGRRGGFGGGFGRDSNNDDDDRGGFGGGRGRRGGFGGGRGFNRDSSEQNGCDDSNDSGGGRGGFGGGRGRGGFGRGRGGFGGGRGQSHDGDGTENGFDNDNNRRSGGFGRGRGGGFSGGTDGDDGGGQGGGFRGRRNSNTADAEGGDAFQNAGEEKPERVTYIPPAPPEEEQEIFKTMQQGINFDNYDNIAVEMSGRDHEQVRPITSFEHCDLYETFKENVKKAHYTKPTPVQKYSIPAILAGRDLMACAQTGSGKTAAFVLPVMTGMINNGLTGGSLMTTQTPQALVVAPTRELANQIYLEARKFAYGTMLRACVCYGGVAVGHQLRQIENGCHLLVATPGRLLDFIERGKISLEAVKFLILDEADRMLDMGFEPTIRKLSDNPALPSKTERQTLMFSATFPEEIQRLAGEFLNDYLFLTVGRVGGTTSDIEQHIVQVSEFEKRDKLVEILNGAGTDRFLVFVETKRSADFLASYLSQTGFPTTSIHGDRQQREREEALEDFKRGRTPVMVATSVAARGLDIPDVKHVINYDLPKEIEEYVHRIGRTGRIGNKGKATSFFQSDRDSAVARGLVKVLGDAEQEVPDWLEENAENAVGTNYGPAGGRFGSRDTRKNNRDGGGDGGNDAGGWGPGDTNDGDDWTSNTAVVDDGGESWD